MHHGYGWVILPALVVLMGWWRLVAPMPCPALVMITDLVRRVLQGDLPEQLSAYAVYDFHKLRMVGDVMDLADTWNHAFRRLRLASCTAGTAALVFGIAGVWTLDADAISPTVMFIRLASFLAFLTAVVVEERLKRHVFGQLAGTISGLVETWQKQLIAGDAGS